MQNKFFSCEKANNNLKPEAIASINTGEIFLVETKNGFGKTFCNQKDFADFMDSDDKKLLNHPCTGPILVKGVSDKNSIAIKIHKIKIKNVFSCISKSTGIKKDNFNERFPKIYNLLEDGKIELNENVYINPKPSIGFIATINDSELKGGRSCNRGGNMDFNQIEEGSIVYLPIYYNKALFAIGDVHFRQASGELSGLALESDATVTMEVFKAEKYDYPIIETFSKFMIVGTEKPENAVDNAINFLQRQKPLNKLNYNDLYQLIGSFGNLELGNFYGKVPTFAISIEKDFFCDKNGFSILKSPEIIVENEKNIDKILEESIKNFNDYKIFHDGDSRQLRIIPNHEEYLISRFNPKVYSFIEKKAIDMPNTQYLRTKINQFFSEYLISKGIKTCTIATKDEYVLVTKEDATKNIEVIVKAAFVGSTKHRYPGLMEAGTLHKPYVRFDWRMDKPFEDILLPEGLAEYFINTNIAKNTVLKTFNIIQSFLKERNLIIYDMCFFLNKNGDTICAEVSPDQMGKFLYTGDNKYYKEIFDNNLKDMVYERWEAFAKIIGAII